MELPSDVNKPVVVGKRRQAHGGTGVHPLALDAHDLSNAHDQSPQCHDLYTLKPRCIKTCCIYSLYCASPHTLYRYSIQHVQRTASQSEQGDRRYVVSF